MDYDDYLDNPLLDELDVDPLDDEDEDYGFLDDHDWDDDEEAGY